MYKTRVLFLDYYYSIEITTNIQTGTTKEHAQDSEQSGDNRQSMNRDRNIAMSFI
jgi:hypothetical protein